MVVEGNDTRADMRDARFGMNMVRRRRILQAAGPLLAANGSAHGRTASIVSLSRNNLSQRPPFQSQAFNMVGVFDIDWLLEPRFTRLLDNMAASPGAFGALRVFGALNSGERENVFPTTSGTVWPRPEAPIDFSVTLDALEALVRRRLVPFIPLTFFPAAVSASPIQPPVDHARWQRLVQAFIADCIERFGAEEVATWWLEVWNEPNMPPFWQGSFALYLDLYRATSEAVIASGHTVRLGGPAIAWLPDQGPGLMDQFLTFLKRAPEVKCDFISFHRKGIWVASETEPDLDRSVEAARYTAQAALRIDAARFRGLPIINNEADMKVAFDTPYEPRMTEQFPAWLMAQAIAYDGLDAEFAAAGFRFWAASDNANQQLIRTPFDGRRSIMTRLSGAEDLVKLPVYGFYEMLRLLETEHGTTSGADAGLYQLVSRSRDAVSAVFALYAPEPRVVTLDLADVPWPRVNVARFCIDADHANAFTAAGRAMPSGNADPAKAMHIRRAAELGVLEPIRRNVAFTKDTIRMQGYAVVLLWITPFLLTPPAAPQWLEARVEGDNVVLRWTPSTEPWFYTYELIRLDVAPVAVAPVPLRAALWIDMPGPGRHTYEVRAVSASGVASQVTRSPAVQVGS